ncbi:hypothetical protein OAI47_01900 [Rhodospirillaceae bacterium]|nr:hypothetical protein [Rhodospirillaceae bacterium]
MTPSYYIKTVPGPSRLSGHDEAIMWEALEIIKKSRETLEPTKFIELLALDAIYQSQNALEPLVGKPKISDYLIKRYKFFETVEDKSKLGEFCYAYIDLPEGKNYPCLLIIANNERQAIWTIFLNAEKKISKVDIITVAPHPNEAIILKKFTGSKKD